MITLCRPYDGCVTAAWCRFPDDDVPEHKVIVALICCAVAIPFIYVLGEAFTKSSEAEFPELQLSWPWKYRILKWRQRWNWAET